MRLLPDEDHWRFLKVLADDSSSFVRSNAKRRLVRQSRRTDIAKRNGRDHYSQKLELLCQRHGPRVAAKVESLAAERYEMLASSVSQGKFRKVLRVQELV
jgi:hypothetical protein